MKNNDYSVIFADEDIVVLNKKSGILIAQDRYNPEAPRLDIIAEKEFGKLYAVHRIDKDTSGIIIYARNSQAQKNISVQFENRQVLKIYHALVRGLPLWSEKTINLPLLPDGDARHRTVVDKKKGKPSETYFRVIGNCGNFSWIEAKPKTGRTHQIRVHLASEKFCIVCDSLYSGNLKPVRLSEIKRNWHGNEDEERPLLSRLALHAYKIEFFHPKTNQKLSFTAEYPRDLEAVRKQFAKIFKVDPLNELVN